MGRQMDNYREGLRENFANYVANYDYSDTKIRLKAEHTYRVATLCEEIAASLKLSDEDICLVWTCGMLHDIGRFEQVRRYGTFFDSISINHAQFGADLLFGEGLYDRLVPADFTEGQRDIIEKAIRVHNMYRVHGELTDRELLFANILRDADKIDILKVNCDTPIEEVYNRPVEDFISSRVSDDVKKAFREHSCAKRHTDATAIDYMIGHVCFIFELVFDKSIEIAHSQGYIYKILDFQSENEDTIEWFEYMKNEINAYIGSRVN